MPSRLCELDIEIFFPEKYYPYVRGILGDIYSGDNYSLIKQRILSIWAAGGYIATVGDRVTYDLLKLGLVPDIAFIDRKEERGPAPRIDLNFFNGYESVINRKSTINMGLCKLIRDRLGNRPWLFIVEGEEDLVGFPVVLALPIGSGFIYGAPGIGAVFVEITDSIKAEAESIIRELL